MTLRDETEWTGTVTHGWNRCFGRAPITMPDVKSRNTGVALQQSRSPGSYWRLLRTGPRLNVLIIYASRGGNARIWQNPCGPFEIRAGLSLLLREHGGHARTKVAYAGAVFRPDRLRLAFLSQRASRAWFARRVRQLSFLRDSPAVKSPRRTNSRAWIYCAT